MMKRYRTKSLVLSLWCLFGAVAASAQVQTATLEYWIDHRFAERTSLPVSGQTVQNVDVSGLCPGIHTLEMRVSDTNGRWGAPLIRHFLKSDTRLADNGLATYEYCIDGDWNNSVQGALSANQIISIDISALCEGIHTLQMHITDRKGQHSQTLLRHFLAFGEDVTKRALTAYRYWVDDFRQQQEGTTSNGQVALDIDVSQLSKGVHTLCYQVKDNTGRWSAPLLRHFLIPDLQVGCDQLVAYEYWFNHGPRHRVELPPAMSINESELLIEVKDVEPARIADDYVFDVTSETVSMDDEVFFGMQVFNGAGIGSLAVLSDTVKMTVMVAPHVMDLHDGDSIGFAAPRGGMMTGWKTTCQASDSLTYRLTAGDIKADFYNGQGQKLTAIKAKGEYGNVVYKVTPDDEVCYLLLHDASQIIEHTTIQLDITHKDEDAINPLTNRFQVSVREQQLIVRSAAPEHVRIVGIAGNVIFDGMVPSGTSTIKVPAGICIVSGSNTHNMKLYIP